jgi:HEAT repeat protein
MMRKRSDDGLARYIDEMASSDQDCGAAAAVALGALGPAALPALPHLFELLRSQEIAVFASASDALVRLHAYSRAVLDGLLTAIASNDLHWGYVAASALGDIEPLAALDMLPRLFQLLRSEHRAVSETARHALFRLHAHSPAVFDGMLTALDDPKPHVRDNVWWYMGETFSAFLDLPLDPRAFEILVADSLNPEIENAAHVLLAWLPPAAVPTWLDVLEQRPGVDGELYNTEQWAFERMGGDALPPLEAAWLTAGLPLRLKILDYASHTQHPNALSLLTQGLGDTALEVQQIAVSRLQWMLESLPLQETAPFRDGVVRQVWRVVESTNPHMRRYCIQILGQYQVAEARTLFRESLFDQSLAIRHAAIYGLGQIEDQAMVPQLLAQLHDADQHTIAAILKALSTMRAVETVPHILTHLSFPEALVRETAAQSLIIAEPTGEVMAGLLKILDDPIWHVRHAAAKTVGTIATEETLITLRRLLLENAGAEPLIEGVLLALQHAVGQAKLQASIQERLGTPELCDLLTKLADPAARYPYYQRAVSAEVILRALANVI